MWILRIASYRKPTRGCYTLLLAHFHRLTGNPHPSQDASSSTTCLEGKAIQGFENLSHLPQLQTLINARNILHSHAADFNCPESSGADHLTKDPCRSTPYIQVAVCTLRLQPFMHNMPPFLPFFIRPCRRTNDSRYVQLLFIHNSAYPGKIWHCCMHPVSTPITFAQYCTHTSHRLIFNRPLP